MARSSKTGAPANAILFTEPPETPPAGVYVANVDGAARGNPGPASYAVVMRDPSGKTVLELAKRLGRETNNVAEYYALIAALDFAINQGIASLRIRSDSELLVRQMQGRYKVKSPDLKPLHERAAKMSRQLAYFAIEHVRREMNRQADALANLALDSGDIQTSRNQSSGTTSASPAAKPTSASNSRGESVGGLRTVRRKIRARFVRGVLVPSEPVNLPEGVEVLLELHIDEKEPV